MALSSLPETMTKMQLTDKEQALFDSIKEGMDEPGCGWLHELDPFNNDHVCAGVLGSLIKKGLVESHEDKDGPIATYWVQLSGRRDSEKASEPVAEPVAEPAVEPVAEPVAELMGGPLLPGEQRPPAAPFKHNVPAPAISRATVANGAALHMLSFHLTEKSANAKTGAMAVSTSSKATCSPSCPFLNSGCYAQSGPLNLHWLKVTSGERGTDFPTFLRKLAALPADSAFRHNQAGDLPHTAGKISRTFIKGMVQNVGHLRAYTYTHHDVKLGENLQLLRYANRNGFTVNVSCETEQQVDNTVAAGLPAVLVVPSDEERISWRTANGNAVLVCPAQRSDSKTCADCMLCHKRGKRVAIAFLAHGTGKRKAEAALSA